MTASALLASQAAREIAAPTTWTYPILHRAALTGSHRVRMEARGEGERCTTRGDRHHSHPDQLTVKPIRLRGELATPRTGANWRHPLDTSGLSMEGENGAWQFNTIRRRETGLFGCSRSAGGRPPEESMSASLRRLRELTGFPVDTMRGWVARARTDAGDRPGVRAAEREEIRALRKELAEVKRANEILKTASAFFAAAELDRRLK